MASVEEGVGFLWSGSFVGGSGILVGRSGKRWKWDSTMEGLVCCSVLV